MISMNHLFVLFVLFDHFQYGIVLDFFPGAHYFDSAFVHENNAIAERKELPLMGDKQSCRVLHEASRSDAPVARDEECRRSNATGDLSPVE